MSLKIVSLVIVVLVILRYFFLKYLIYQVSKDEIKKIEFENETQHQLKTIELSNSIKKLKKNTKITLKRKETSHLYGLQFMKNSYGLDLLSFDKIIEFNKNNNTVRVGGNTNLSLLIKYLYKNGYGMKVIPDEEHLTIGGLYAGIGGGSRTFKYGCFFNIVKQVEIITGNGDIIICNKNKNTKLFKLLPSSLGTLGYVVSIWLDIEKIKPYIYSKTYHYKSYKEFIKNMELFMDDETIDFLDGTIFNSTNFVIIIGKQVSTKGNYPLYGTTLGTPYDTMVENGYEGVFNYLDFIYKWDTDGYYSFRSKDMILYLLRNRFIRALLDKRLFKGHRKRRLGALFGKNILDENNQIKVQNGDFMLPIKKSQSYFTWYDKNVNLYPLYMCPIKFPTKSPFINTDTKSIDFGMGYGVVKENVDRVELLRKCMIKTYELGGDMLKYNSIYSSEDEFWSFYDSNLKKEYYTVKNKYDTNNRYYSVSEKLSLK